MESYFLLNVEEMFSKCKIVRSSRVPTHQSPAEMLILIEIIHHDHQLPGRIPHYSCCVSRLVFPGKTAPDSCTESAMLSVSTPFHSTLFTSSLPARWSPPPSPHQDHPAQLNVRGSSSPARWRWVSLFSVSLTWRWQCAGISSENDGQTSIRASAKPQQVRLAGVFSLPTFPRISWLRMEPKPVRTQIESSQRYSSSIVTRITQNCQPWHLLPNKDRSKPELRVTDEVSQICLVPALTISFIRGILILTNEGGGL